MTPVVTSEFRARCICGRQEVVELDIRDPWRWAQIQDRLRDQGWRHDDKGRRMCPTCAVAAARVAETAPEGPSP